MGDYIIRGCAASGQFRFFAATTRDLTEKARVIHNTTPVVTAALGRLLTAASMMGAMAKSDTDLTTIQIKGDGPIGGLVVTVDGTSTVKGYPHHAQVDLPPKYAGKLDVGRGIGAGYVSVIRDMGLREPYVGQTALVSGEIAEDLTYYFTVSEQIPSSVALGVLVDTDTSVKQAGGFIIQVMPDATDEAITQLEERLKTLPAITSLLEEGKTPEAILEQVFADMEPEILARRETAFACNCSKERVSKAIISLGKKEITDMIQERKPIEVSCHFCNRRYSFEPEELEQMLS